MVSSHLSMANLILIVGRPGDAIIAILGPYCEGLQGVLRQGSPPASKVFFWLQPQAAKATASVWKLNVTLIVLLRNKFMSDFDYR